MRMTYKIKTATWNATDNATSNTTNNTTYVATRNAINEELKNIC